MSSPQVHVVGGGLAGSEASYFLAERGYAVILYEMRPKINTEAHQTGQFAELVCSNSLKSTDPQSAPGMMKAEMNLLGSLILRSAAQATVPAGEALGVDRDRFAELVTQKLRSHPNIKIVSEDVTEPPRDGITLICTGPLTSPSLTQWIEKTSGSKDLYFYDAIAPILDASTIDMKNAFLANRYDKGEEPAYLNCPMSESEYEAFINALLSAQKVPARHFEEEKFFQGCQPIEAIVEKGRQSLRFGPMKPVGLTNPLAKDKPYAVVQLRPENLARTAYNIVGFQTKLKYGEQKRVFRMIPALAQAEFFRMGSIHRNTFICSPSLLRPDLSLKGKPSIYFAGQITGVEGYLESAACGMLAALFIEQRLKKERHSAPPAHTALGALLRHITGSDPKKYAPSNIHFGLFDPTLFQNLHQLNREETRSAMATQAITNFSEWTKKNQIRYV